MRAVSSVVRALASHARGHWFKSSTAHHAEVAEWQTRYVQGVVSVRACEFKSHLRHQKVNQGKYLPVTAELSEKYALDGGYATGACSSVG